MATGSAQDEQGLPKDEVQQLRSEFQLVVEQGQASMMLAMRDMMAEFMRNKGCLLYTSPSPRDRQKSRMPSSA